MLQMEEVHVFLRMEVLEDFYNQNLEDSFSCHE